jgi:isoleucyl-tRNA synthetase
MYKEYKQLDLPKTGNEILARWKQLNIFEKSISNRPEDRPYTFYEGPPSANGMPGIHHVMARAIKDIFCRYKTLKGYRVERKGGWDTHGLPIELAVEKTLGITKDDIGKKISVEAYNAACRKEVMKYTDVWNHLTEKMGYWVDLEHPYITYDNAYIESLWWILCELYKGGFLYKGYTIQPYSPAAGTGLSSHELNQPGTYRNVSDTTIVAQFKAVAASLPEFLKPYGPICFLAWTTTPWTLPSNTALAVGPKIDYVLVKTFNQYTFEPVQVILAKALLGKQFTGKYFASEDPADFAAFKADDKKIPYSVLAEFSGVDLTGIRYEQLLPLALPYQNPEHAFRVIAGDFVTTEDGTGIVHIAPTFGADDARAAKAANPEIPPMLVLDEQKKPVPLVDLQGRFIAALGNNLGGRFVKNEYYAGESAPERSVDVEIAILLKEENKAFKVEKYVHSYPHCWRTDKPVLYYPLDSWFIRTTAVKDKLVTLNKTINWKPEATGTGRFGNWLENLVDWNLSRSRYWGTPLPIWRSKDNSQEICIGSVAELKTRIANTLSGSNRLSTVQKEKLQSYFTQLESGAADLHRPFVDDVVLAGENGELLYREPDLIDVWFDSGAMPYAQWHYPFENQEKFEQSYPADFIAEGVDQTRGWFFTLHTIAVLLSETSDDIKAANARIGNKGISFKNVVSNGLVLDKNGNKMSKRLGNAVDPFSTIDHYSADATRWYMISNAAPWENLKFNAEGIDEVRRKFFGTLYNTYAFFSLYANIDGFSYREADMEQAKRPEIDRWIISRLNTLVQEADGYYNDFEPTRATRAIQDFVDEHLSNWYVRLCRRRFWKGEYSEDKISAYQTLYTCLITVAKLMSPVAPFFSDQLYLDLDNATGKEQRESVHLADFPPYNEAVVDKGLEERMALAQEISSLVLSLRKKVGINVRQPLNKILLPVLDKSFKTKVERVKELILSETNVKSIEYITDTSGIIHKKIKPNFKLLGPKVGKDMKAVGEALASLSQDEISQLENNGTIMIPGTRFSIAATDVEIIAEDVPGWQVANLGKLTVALDVNLTTELKQEGISREMVNRIQNLRKDKGFEVTDKITVKASNHPYISEAVKNNLSYICAEILADSFELDSKLADGEKVTIDDTELTILITKA